MYDFMLHEMPIQTQARGNMITYISMPGNRGYNFQCRYEVQHNRYNYEVQLYNFHIVYSCKGVGNLFM